MSGACLDPQNVSEKCPKIKKPWTRFFACPKRIGVCQRRVGVGHGVRHGHASWEACPCNLVGEQMEFFLSTLLEILVLAFEMSDH